MTRSADIARYMLVCDPTLCRQPTKLSLLVYLAQAHSLGWTGKPLFDDAIIAAPEGPMPAGLVKVRTLMRPWSLRSRTPRIRRMPR